MITHRRDTARQAANKRKSKGKRQKSLRRAAGWPQSKQSPMTQFLSGAKNWPPRGIFAARKETRL
jgi:hypothetical protein